MKKLRFNPKSAKKKMYLKMLSAEVVCCKQLPNITDKLSIIMLIYGIGVRISSTNTVACGFSLFKIHNSDNPKRINDFNVFSLQYRYS